MPGGECAWTLTGLPEFGLFLSPLIYMRVLG
jgi:hypothetical protein